MTETARDLEGTVAIVTGSSRNIGRALAMALANAGAAIIVNAKSSRGEAETVAREIEANGGRSFVHLADVTDPGAVKGMVEAAVGAFDRLDILVNNAALRRDAPIAEVTFEDWRAVLSSILDAAFLCSQACIPHLAKHGRGSIVNIGGVAGHVGVAHRPHVAAAKSGLVGLTKALAAELAAERITVNCIAPGYIETSRKGHLPAHFRERPVPLGRPGQPEEIAAMVCHLCGDSGRFITGQTIHLNGGWYMP
jgi:3-oxoacyl-[acyl-carrier protein] reductase